MCSTSSAACGGTIDPSSIWRVQPKTAMIEGTKAGYPWDTDGSAPDVKIVVTCPPDARAITPLVESYTPVWSAGSCTATAGALTTQRLRYQAYDGDTFNDDPISGVVEVQLTEVMLKSGSYASSMKNGGLISIVLELVRQ